jgi:lysophospholipase L1-like esterase
MKKEWILTLASVVITVVVALGLVRWLAPGLLGYAVDQRLVQVSEEVPPFFNNIFREDDLNTDNILVNDPVLVARGRPLFPDIQGMGPNDILGFRNRNVPNSPNIIVIGDSQTYGNNAQLELNWPSQLEKALFPDSLGRIYNMSTGAWGGVNYLEIIDTALHFNPQVIIVAFYMGNDSYSDFRNTYSIDAYAYLRPDLTLTSTDQPQFHVPSDPDDLLDVKFSDGVTTVFTPGYRLSANDRSEPSVLAGYDIMARTAVLMAEKASSSGVKIVFTIIPTKEMVYSRKIDVEGISLGEEFQTLINDEKLNTQELAEALRQIDGALYVDIVAQMQEAAMSSKQLYPPDSNGHPFAEGYGVIAKSLLDAVNQAFTMPMSGAVGLTEDGELARIVVLTNEGLWDVPTVDILLENNWDLTQIPAIPHTWINNFPYLGTINEVDPERFSPEALGL